MALIAKYADKEQKTAKILVINEETLYDAYLVGSKIYMDFADEINTTDSMKITFTDEDGSILTGTYALFVTGNLTTASDEVTRSAAVFTLTESVLESFQTVFTLENDTVIYTTQTFTVVQREGLGTPVDENDPKGIYFAPVTVNLSVGTTFQPTVLGVRNSADLTDACTFAVVDGADDASILAFNGKLITALKPGTVYITAFYDYTDSDGQTKTYQSAAMKIIIK